jgi:DNA-binding SARP family transcriptional activator
MNPQTARQPAPVAPLNRGDAHPGVLEALPYGVVVLDATGSVLDANGRAEELLGRDVVASEEAVSCCSLLGCRKPGTPLAEACLTELARESTEVLPEIRLDLPPDDPAQAAWVTARPLGEKAERVVLHLRPGDLRDRRRRTEPHWIGDQNLKVSALGRTTVQRGSVSIGGGWIDQRAGQLLKYLICERDRVVAAEEIAEAIWPNAEHRTVLGRVRHYVHGLRSQLEPERDKHAESAFIVAHPGGYALARDRFELDVDEFERHVSAGLGAFRNGHEEDAERELQRAATIYKGDFLADEPFADWAFSERERLRSLMSAALRVLADIELRKGEPDGAAVYLERLAALQPFDTDVHRDLIALCLQRGRRSEALRRYTTLRSRLQRQFGEELDFKLADATEAANGPLRLA